MTDSLTSLAGALAAIGERAGKPDLAATVAQVRDELAQDTHANFLGGHDPDGATWDEPKHPLQPAGRPLLVRTGYLLLSSVSQLADATAYDDGFDAAPAWGPFYGIFHEDGVPEKNLPARPFTGWSENRLDDAAGKIADSTVAALLEVFP